MAAVVEGEWPVTAREAELAEIDEWTAAGVGVLLVGEQGAGKTTLLNAALEQAGGHGDRVVSGDAVRDLLNGGTAPAAHRRVTVAIDDVHLVDRVTLELVCRLVGGGRAVLLASTEPGAALPDALRRLLIGKRVRRLAVDALDRSGVVRMLTARLGGPVAVDAAARFWDLTRGNPLILREVADQALAEGSLRRVGGRWWWPGLQGTPDSRLVDLVDLLLGELDPGERELVNMLAFAGPLEAGLPVVDALREAAEALNHRGVLVAERSRSRLSLRLAHPFCAAVVAANLPELTARRLRSEIADAILGTGARRSGDAVRIAALSLGTRASAGPARLREAAAGALRAEDHPLAERLSRAALAAGAASAASGAAAGVDAGAVVLLGEALAGQSRHVEAEACFARAAHSAAVLRPRALNMGLGLGRLAEAEAVAETDLGARALVRLLKDRIGEARQLAVTAEGAGALLALLRHESGDDEGTPAVGPGPAQDVEHLYVAGLVAAHTGGPAGARPVLAELRAAADGGGRRGRTYARLLEAHLLRAEGRAAEAVELLREAAAFGGTTDWLATRSLRLARLAGAVAESGDAAEAASLLAEAREAQREECAYPLMADAVELEAALVTARQGDHAAAAARALEVAGRALAAGRNAQALSALHLAARTGAAPRAAAIRTPAGPGGSAGGAVVLRHVLALAEGDGAALDEVSGRFAALGLLPLAAEAAYQAAGAHQAAGNRRAARAAQAAGAELVARGGVEPPVWAVPADRREQGAGTKLTAREREVAALAVSRLSNQEIADRLVLSVRTVENHLYHAYGKLGVTARKELATVLAEPA
ncbi:LuxR C-terminal-related transcriptional regulator [Kitasatospora sp. NPDC088548]|uniref:helix-turn-helix transcriptional regulator n=1 Tax=Kitasatospora sp. NPDC088548 TaxID=3364075 RepID=UPI0038247F26